MVRANRARSWVEITWRLLAPVLVVALVLTMQAVAPPPVEAGSAGAVPSIRQRQLNAEAAMRRADRQITKLQNERRNHAKLFKKAKHQLKVAIKGRNAVRRARGEAELDAIAFMKLVKEKAKLVELDEQLLKRNVNVGFSGGEKKRNEILQMAMLEPKFAILDETDSGLDIDALRVIAGGVNALRSPERSILLITHYQRLLDYIQPDFVHVLVAGRIVRSGDKQLALQLEEKGYGWIESEVAA